MKQFLLFPFFVMTIVILLILLSLKTLTWTVSHAMHDLFMWSNQKAKTLWNPYLEEIKVKKL